jgi:hypothetical protein
MTTPRYDRNGQTLTRGDSVHVGDRWTGYNSQIAGREAGNFVRLSNGSVTSGQNVVKN